MSVVYHFTTTENKEVKIYPDDVRHVEYTINSYGEDVIIMHLTTTGEEYILDGRHPETKQKVNFLLAQINKADITH